MRILLTLVILALLPLHGALAQEVAAPLEILRITPSGDDVAPARQIVIEFSRPVVAAGKMDRTAAEVGVSISPALECNWRWINTSALACNLDGDAGMKQSTRYNVRIEPVITALDGGKIAKSVTHEFVTERVDAGYTSFSSWRGPGSPVIRISFNQPVTGASVMQHIYFDAKGTRVALKAKRDKNDGEQGVHVQGKGTYDGEARRVWLVEPIKPLPLDEQITLKMEAGLVSTEGNLSSAAARDVVTFDTFPPLRLAGVQCATNEGESILIAPDTQDAKLCNPMRPVSLAFTAPVLRSDVKDNARFSPALNAGNKDFDPWGKENRDYTRLGQPHRKGEYYSILIPVSFKAAQQYTVSFAGNTPKGFIEKVKAKLKKQPENLAGLRDEFGRYMPQASVTFKTDHRPPNFELVHNHAVLEKDVDSEVPLYVNNLKNFKFNYRSVTQSGARENQSIMQIVPAVQDVQFAVPAGVREMLGGQSGVLYGTLVTDPVVEKGAASARLLAQVTPFQVHLKLGHFRSIAWVTHMVTGAPVEGANVTITKQAIKDLAHANDVLADVYTDENGFAVLPGTEEIDPTLQNIYGWDDGEQSFQLRVSRGSDMALLPINGQYAVDMWQVSDGLYNRMSRKHDYMQAWGMTAQGIYRAGDTMQYKIFVRDEDNKKLILPPEGATYSLEIQDPAGKTVDKRDITLSEFGSYAGEYAIPKTAAVGWYDFTLRASFGRGPDGEVDERVLYPVRVLVSDFTPAPFRVSTDVAGELFHSGDKVDVEIGGRLHSGGAYGGAAARMSAYLSNSYFSSDHQAAKDFSFDTYRGVSEVEIARTNGALDDKGVWAQSFTLESYDIIYGTLDIEGAVQDDRGKSIAAEKRVKYVGVDRFVGLRSKNWSGEAGKPFTVDMIVVDAKGVPVPGVAITGRIEREEVNVARVKGAGNAYITDITRDWVDAGACAAESAAEGVACTFTPGQAGSWRVTASVTDEKGREHSTELGVWITGADYVQWADQEDYELSVIPEATNYKVGDTARFLVKNPYPGATAMISVERYGVMDEFTMTLEDSTPVIEIPVKEDYMPGFYVSVLVVSPRVEKPLGENQIDLGKPAFRMGYAQITVDDDNKRMDVDVTTDKGEYQPREKVKVDLLVSPRTQPAEDAPVELAVAVLDEAVFDMIAAGADAFDPYEGFYGLDALEVANYSLLTRLVGRQKFEKKGANPGGDGGAEPGMRNQFKFVSYWNPSVPVDADGKAVIEFEAPDNLTGWKVLAIATMAGDRMGLGDGGFAVNQPTEIRPVMPNIVREGDKFSAGFSVMNRTDHARTLRVEISAEGPVAGDVPAYTETITLEPYKRASVFMPVEAAWLPQARYAAQGEILFKVSAADEEDSDALEFRLPVLKARVYEVGGTYGTSEDTAVEEKISYPADIFTDVGELSVTLSPSVIANVEGAFSAMRDYPYTCWEQQLTRGVMASHYQSLKDYMPQDFEWRGSDTLTADMLARAADYQAPNGGMAYFVADDERADPYLSAYTALAFGWLKDKGHAVPMEVERKLHEYLLTLLRQDAMPSFYSPGMAASVRAVALAALADVGSVSDADIDRYRPALKDMSLFGKAHFMQAALLVGGRDDTAKEAAEMIFTSANETGGKLTFSEELFDEYDRILATPARDNCAVLDALMMYTGSEEGRAFVGDKPFKMVRAISQTRGKRDGWENTQENMFCMKALSSYAARYESVKPDMSVSAEVSGEKIGEAKFAALTDKAVTLEAAIKEDAPGTESALKLTKDGAGRYYYATRLRYAPKHFGESPVNAGMDIAREYHVFREGGWILLSDPAEIKRGDVVRVDLFLSLPAPRSFVVVDDPLPGGLETVNRDLATASGVDADAGAFDEAGGSFWFKYGDWQEYGASLWSFYHKELRHDSARFYADYLPAGNYHLSYTAQAVAEGDFTMLPTRAEEMYDPDVYALGVKDRLSVGDAP